MENIKKYAELFGLLCENFKGAQCLGKKASQKMFYFFEREGISLNLRYGIHFYGPYSAKLDNVMHILESEDYISIDTSKTTHEISLGTERVEESMLSQEEKKTAASVIESFAHKTPLELEVLTTMDYIANSILPEHVSDEERKQKFKEIKGTKFNDSAIDEALTELKGLGLIAV